MRWLASKLVLVLVCFLLAPVSSAWSQPVPKEKRLSAKKKKAKRRKKKLRRKRRRSGRKRRTKKKKAKVRVPRALPRVSNAGKRESKLSPNAPSRWSNSGAMNPIVSEVAVGPAKKLVVQAPSGTAKTEPQSLTKTGRRNSFRFFARGYRYTISNQDVVFQNQDNGGDITAVPVDNDPSISLLRFGTVLDAADIGAEEIALRVDAEYRPDLSRDGRTDIRLDEVSLTYGLRSLREQSKLNLGVSIGRLLIREAGYFRVDGGLVRLRAAPRLHVGAFGGFGANPYGYVWRLQKPQVFSFDWARGGIFLSTRQKQFSLTTAVAASTLVKDIDVGDPPVPQSGVDRLYVYVDGAYSLGRQASLFLNGFFDLAKGTSSVQKVDLSLFYRPKDRNWTLATTVGRFSTVLYRLATGASFAVDPQGNQFDPVNFANIPVVDENGNPILPFDGALYQTAYNYGKVRGGFWLAKDFELYSELRLLLRDRRPTNQAAEALGAETDLEPLRFVPRVGTKRRDPHTVDFAVDVLFFADKSSQARSLAGLTLGREIVGVYSELRGRYLFGNVDAWDATATLSYQLRSPSVPGRLRLMASGQYIQENIFLEEPVPGQDILQAEDVRTARGAQKVYSFLFGIDWRL